MSALDNALDLMAALRDPVGTWGDMATPEQWSDAEAILDLDGPRRHWLGRAKGGSARPEILRGCLLVSLLIQFPAGAQGFVAAANHDQAGLLRQSMASFVEPRAELQGRVTIDQRRIYTPSGGHAHRAGRRQGQRARPGARTGSS